MEFTGTLFGGLGATSSENNMLLIGGKNISASRIESGTF